MQENFVVSLGPYQRLASSVHRGESAGEGWRNGLGMICNMPRISLHMQQSSHPIAVLQTG